MSMPTNRTLKFYEALLEAQDQCMAKDPTVYLMGLGVPDPKGIFGTTTGLQEKYGAARVLDMPLSENGMTGVAIGSALAGMRPVMTHQRVDFAILAMDQIVNQAAKWHYMFHGQSALPLVIRMIVGRGWGQGPQHSQSLQAWFAHIPGLKVVMPSTPYEAKGLLVSSIEDNNPVIFIEHRWLHGTHGPVPESLYRLPLNQARIAREGRDVTVVATSYMVIEALRAAEQLALMGIEVEVIDLRVIRPLDEETLLASIRKTGRLLVADTGAEAFGISAEVVAALVEKAFSFFKTAPRRLASPDFPAPTSPVLSAHYYPTASHIFSQVLSLMDFQEPRELPSWQQPTRQFQDQPDASFMGPF